MTKRVAGRASTLDVSARAAAGVALLAPGAAAGEWELLRPRTGSAPGASGSGSVTRQTFASLDAAAANLEDAERFVLALPLSLGLVHRLTLPAAEASELADMARIQLEKILPYPVESVSLALTELSRSDAEVTVAIDTVHEDALTALCQPLVARGAWPLRVVFQARLVGASLPAGETAAFVCQEEGRFVLGLCEDGKLGFAQVVAARSADELATELPAVLLGAELEGLPTNFNVLSLDRRAGDSTATLRAALNVAVEPFEPGLLALGTVGLTRNVETGDLALPGWKIERLRGERLAGLRRRLLLGLAIYLAVVVLAFVGAGILLIRVRVQRSHVARLRPLAEYAETSIGHWRKLAPAIDASRYLTETMHEVYECLPPDSSVLWTSFELTPRTLTIQGEAPSPSAAVDFTDKLKARPDLRMYHFEAEPPAALANGRTRFRVTGMVPER